MNTHGGIDGRTDARIDGRTPDALRPCTIEPGFINSALGSALISTGGTRVICTASAEDRAPGWLSSGGWVTAQYAMLPGATSPRGRRDPGGRGKEIQRLIGRSLRAAVDLSKLVDGGNNAISIVCDCDVIEADGGTRTASITGAFVALSIALAKLRAQGRLTTDPLRNPVAAVSVGIVESRAGSGGDAIALLDLCYEEDSRAVVDLNVVQTPSGLVEVQGTGEQGEFSRAQLTTMLDLADAGIAELMRHQQTAIEAGIKAGLAKGNA